MIHKPWFKAKRYGYGWYPATWQAWIILSIYVLLVAYLIIAADRYASSEIENALMVTIPCILLTIWLIITSYATGEKARWRWGTKG